MVAKKSQAVSQMFAVCHLTVVIASVDCQIAQKRILPEINIFLTHSRKRKRRQKLLEQPVLGSALPIQAREGGRRAPP